MTIPSWRKFLIMGAACGLVSCGRKSIDLPNGYSLHDHGKIWLQAPDGHHPTKEEISQFMVSGPHVYGWINNQLEEYFDLDTKSGVFSVFPRRQSLDEHTDKLSLPRLGMKDSYTYWDVLTGRKHW